MKPETKKYLERVNTENHGLIDTARGWISDGWDLDGDASPEQIAAALLMEAKTQDECVKAGDSAASFPELLREIGISIIEYEHPVQPTIPSASKERIFALLPRAVKSAGVLDPVDSLSFIEEDLTSADYDACKRFLEWLIANERTFGHNLPEVWAEWEATK